MAPCGAGKSIIGAAAIARTGQPSLVCVHTKDLLEQWRDHFIKIMGITPGIVAEGKVDVGRITIGMVQTLSSMPPKELTDFGKQFGCVVVDECHHTPATTFRTVLAALPAQWRLGLSATPTRADGLDAMLRYCIGPTVYRVTHERLVEGGHLIVPDVCFVETLCTADVKTHADTVSAFIQDQDRNRIILDLTTREARAGHTVLVLSNRVRHCEEIAERLREEGICAESLTGQAKKKTRKDILKRFRDGDLPVVVSSQLADEGLDVPRLDRIILATPSRAEGRTVQRLGRAMRTSPGKSKPILFDLVDSHGIARAQYSARMQAYRQVIDPGCFSWTQ